MCVPIPDGVDGSGVTIAVIDSFACPHPDLQTTAHRRVRMVDATADGWKASDFSADKKRPAFEHGIAVAGVAAGTGKHPGVAPRANLVLVNGVCTSRRGKRTIMGDARQFAAVVRWLTRRANAWGIRVLVITAGANDNHMGPWQASPVRRALEEATDAGVLAVCIASNTPFLSPPPPGGGPSVVTVGGVLGGRKGRASFELYAHCWGTTADGRPSPDLVMPCDMYHPLPPTPDQPVAYTYASEGATSLATPRVAGVAALCLQANPGLGPRQLRQILISACRRLRHLPAEKQGAGLLDPRRAVALSRKARPHREKKTAYARDGIPGLTRKLRFTAASTREAALNQLWWHEKPGLKDVQRMLPLLNGEHPEVVSTVLLQIARFKRLSRVAWQSDALAHTSPHVRSAWGHAAAGANPVAAIKLLLGDSDKDVRYTASRLANQHPHEALLAPLVDAMGETGNWPLFVQCRLAAEKISGQTFKPGKISKPEPKTNLDRLAMMQADVHAQWREWLMGRSLANP